MLTEPAIHADVNCGKTHGSVPDAEARRFPPRAHPFPNLGAVSQAGLLRNALESRRSLLSLLRASSTQEFHRE